MKKADAADEKIVQRKNNFIVDMETKGFSV